MAGVTLASTTSLPRNCLSPCWIVPDASKGPDEVQNRFFEKARCKPFNHCDCKGARFCSESGYCFGDAGVCGPQSVSLTPLPTVTPFVAAKAELLARYACCSASSLLVEAWPEYVPLTAYSSMQQPAADRHRCLTLCEAASWCTLAFWNARETPQCSLVVATSSVGKSIATAQPDATEVCAKRTAVTNVGGEALRLSACGLRIAMKDACGPTQAFAASADQRGAWACSKPVQQHSHISQRDGPEDGSDAGRAVLITILVILVLCCGGVVAACCAVRWRRLAEARDAATFTIGQTQAFPNNLGKPLTPKKPSALWQTQYFGGEERKNAIADKTIMVRPAPEIGPALAAVAAFYDVDTDAESVQPRSGAWHEEDSRGSFGELALLSESKQRNGSFQRTFPAIADKAQQSVRASDAIVSRAAPPPWETGNYAVGSGLSVTRSARSVSSGLSATRSVSEMRQGDGRVFSSASLRLEGGQQTPGAVASSTRETPQAPLPSTFCHAPTRSAKQ